MSEMEVIKWLFGTSVFAEACNWPVHVDGLVAAKRQLDGAIASKSAAPDVEQAYRKFAGAVGPSVMTSLLESDDAFPEVNHSDRLTPPSPGKVTLYVDTAGKRVLAECTKEHGMPPKFSVE